jgi:hypothetical protein
MTEQAGGSHDGRDRDQVGGELDQAGGSRDSKNWSAAVDGGPGSAERPSRGQSGRQPRSRQGGPASGLVDDFQRWLVRTSARNMRNQIGGQVRRTLGSGRNERGDVWDVATTEPPPGAGESPECQWCPICRAARAMRESGPDVGSQISTAGNAVASAVQEALKAFDSVLNRPGGSAPRSPGSDRWTGRPEDWDAERDRWAAEHGGLVAEPWPTVEVIAVTEPETPDASLAGAGPDTGPAQDVTSEPDGTDEPDDRS